MSWTIEAEACMRVVCSGLLYQIVRPSSSERSVLVMSQLWHEDEPPDASQRQRLRCPDDLGSAWYSQVNARSRFSRSLCRAQYLIAREPPACSSCILTAPHGRLFDFDLLVVVVSSWLPPLWASRNAEYRLRTDSLI